MDKWISVKDRLPEKEGKYLTVRPSFINGRGLILDICVFSKCLEKVDKVDFYGRRYAGFYEYDREYGYAELRTVTHWMPLPEPPKDTE